MSPSKQYMNRSLHYLMKCHRTHRDLCVNWDNRDYPKPFVSFRIL